MMNGPHLHLIVNHIPIFGTVFGSILLLIGLLKKSIDLKKAGLLFLIIASLATILAYYSGEASPRVVKALPGVARSYIHNHAEAGERALFAIGVLGALALLSWLLSLRRAGVSNKLYLLCFLLSLPVAFLMAYATNLGGQIRHTEIRSDFIPPAPSNPTSAPAGHDH